jgi:hypothetical protein
MMSAPFRWRILLATIPLITFTGCLTIEEHYTFNKKGGGTMQYIVDLSELGSLMESFGDAADGDKGKDEGFGAMDMGAQVEAIKSIPGIGKVKLDTKTKWVQKLSFSFKDVNALNGALNQLMRDSSGVRHEFFRWDGKTLVRTNNAHAYELGAGMAKGDGDGGGSTEEGELDMSMMLASMKYKYSFKFAEPIASCEQAEGVNMERPKPNTVALDTDFAVISRDPKALDLRVALGR